MCRLKSTLSIEQDRIQEGADSAVTHALWMLPITCADFMFMRSATLHIEQSAVSC
jgi:hypothetical protein